MTYAEAVQELVRAAEKAGSPISLEKPGAHVFAARVFNAALLAEMNAAGYPAGAFIPHPGEDIGIWAFDELEARQDGYVSPEWDADKHVIADWNADPITIASTGEVFFSRHGAGAWTYEPLAPDLATLFSVLARWVDYHAGERERWNEQVRQNVLAGLAPNDAETFLAFLSDS